MSRIAQCCCGLLRAEVIGEPASVAACHCVACQRRTGSAFGVATYFSKEQVHTKGPNKVYDRSSDSGRKVELHFCPDCGSTGFGTRSLTQDLSAFPLGRSLIPPCLGRRYLRGRRQGIPG
ncbi:GFA family protein [Bradyrhizobium sp. Leo121]|uniref:GFA family protein n=1 Tax=Bradyrhizobium sp. Leo121 TaxID=1571195 RepID=UPI001FDEE82D|nr:GFA family protein [Bradyrhizobium sp. Leo121]